MNTQIIAIANQKGRRWQNHHLCDLGNRSGTGRKESAADRRGPARKPDNQLGQIPQPDKLPFTLSDAMGRS